MTPTRYELIRRIFLDARELPPEKRRGFLVAAATRDPEIAGEVEQLLAAEDDGSSFLNSPAIESGLAAGLIETRDTGRETGAHQLEANPTVDSSGPGTNASINDCSTLRTVAASKAGTQMGPYRILRTIGEGGMGTVYEAEQRSPIVRKVALKVVKLGMDTREVIARFESERQALALMDHANIARVLDAGATEAGRPYFVMELVKGEPITKYCDVVEMPLRERLELFVQVCHAVQHAHTKGVIHRDIKSSNVLVTLADGKPAPKVIDFGIAKATSGKLTDKTVVTQMQQIVGTPAYMSPEQAELTAIDIDTRSDIYSLGVLLYELLTGQLPFDPARMRSASLAELQRIIRDEEPPTPSRRVSTLGASAADVASRRRIDPHRLRRTLQGDLDWIVMKCVEKDRGRRYETANGLAADLARYLSGEPVVAAPPGRTYRIRKFLRRNRGSVVAGALLATTLLVGLGGTTIGFVQARSEADAKQAQWERAEKAARRSEKVSMLLKNTLAGAGPGVARGRDPTLLKELLQESADQLDRRPVDPEVEAELRMVIGGTLTEIGDIHRAEEQISAAIRVLRNMGERSRIQLADALELLVNARAREGRWSEARGPVNEAYAIRRAQSGESKELGHNLHFQAWIESYSGEVAKGETLYREALRIKEAACAPDDPSLAVTLTGLGDLLVNSGRAYSAIPLLERAVVLLQSNYGESHPDVATALSHLGNALSNSGRAADAIAPLSRALELRVALTGTDSLDAAFDQAKLATAHELARDFDAAERLYRSALAILESKLSPTHAYVGVTYGRLGSLYLSKRDYPNAESALRRSIEIQKAHIDAENPDAMMPLYNLARALDGLDRPEEAVPIARTVVRVYGEKLPPTLFSRRYAEALLARILTHVVRNDPHNPDANSILREAETLLITVYHQLQPNSQLSPEQKINYLFELHTWIIALYEQWHAAQPDDGYDTKAAEWRGKFAEWQASTQPVASTDLATP